MAYQLADELTGTFGEIYQKEDEAKLALAKILTDHNRLEDERWSIIAAAKLLDDDRLDKFPEHVRIYAFRALCGEPVGELAAQSLRDFYRIVDLGKDK